MTGSGDTTDIKDIMLAYDMTLLEAVIYSAILDYGERAWIEVADQARHHAKYIIEHLPPEIPHDRDPAKRPGPVGTKY